MTLFVDVSTTANHGTNTYMPALTRNGPTNESFYDENNK
jgi:hypothetical protein